MSAKGTSVKQDCRFKDKQSVLLKGQFPESYYSGLVLKDLPKKPFEIYLRDILEAKFPQDQIAQDSAWNYVQAVWHQLYGPDFRKLEIDLLGVLAGFTRPFIEQLIAIGLQATASQDGIGRKVKEVLSRKLSVKQRQIRELDEQRQRRAEQKQRDQKKGQRRRSRDKEDKRRQERRERRRKEERREKGRKEERRRRKEERPDKRREESQEESRDYSREKRREERRYQRRDQRRQQRH